MICPHCQAEVTNEEMHCGACGMTLRVRSSVPRVARAASCSIGRTMVDDLIRRTRSRVTRSCFTLGASLLVISCAMGVLAMHDRTNRNSMGTTVNTFLPGGGYSVIATLPAGLAPAMLGFFFVGCSFWSRWRPKHAAYAGVCVYLAFTAIEVALKPAAIADSILFKIIIVSTLLSAVRNGRVHDRLVADASSSSPDENNGAAGWIVRVEHEFLTPDKNDMPLEPAIRTLQQIGFGMRERVSPRPESRLCGTCGYDLIGIGKHSPCPECGTRRDRSSRAVLDRGMEAARDAARSLEDQPQHAVVEADRGRVSVAISIESHRRASPLHRDMLMEIARLVERGVVRGEVDVESEAGWIEIKRRIRAWNLRRRMWFYGCIAAIVALVGLLIAIASSA